MSSVLGTVDGRPTPVGAIVQPIARDDGVVTTTRLVTEYALESYATAVAAGTAIAGEATTFMYMGPGSGMFSLTHSSTTPLILFQVRVAQSSIGFVEFYDTWRNDCLFTQSAGSDPELVVCQHIGNDGIIKTTFSKSPSPVTTVADVVVVAETQTSSDGWVDVSVSPSWQLKIIFVYADSRAKLPLREHFRVSGLF
jgi:hypothetical protein